MKFYRVVSITNSPEKYPWDKEDSLEFPDLIEEVEDEEELFIIDTVTGDHYPARDFFYMVNVKDFAANLKYDLG